MNRPRKKPGPKPKGHPVKKKDSGPEPTGTIFDDPECHMAAPEEPPAILEREETPLDDQEPEETPPEDFPEPAPAPDVDPHLGRLCPKCGNEASRITSNDLGVIAYCLPCGFNWPVRMPRPFEVPITMPRGLRKQTIASPDFGSIWDDTPEEY
jgi:hypothetical protein